MKKKMLFMAALAGAVTLGSCVKDDVSSSVEAVRQAKAAELNSIAAKNNAEAATTEAVRAAEVAYKQALAAVEQANAEGKQLENELAKGQLAAELEATIAKFQAETQGHKNDLAKALRDAMTAQSDDVKALLANFWDAYDAFTGAQAEVVAAKTALEKAKIDADYAEGVHAADVKVAQDKVAEKTALIEALKEIKATAMTQSEINAAGQAKLAEFEEAEANFVNNPAIDKFLDAVDAWVAAYKKYDAFVNDDPEKGVFAALNKKALEVTTSIKYYETLEATNDIAATVYEFADYSEFSLSGPAGEDKIAKMEKIKTPTFRMQDGAKIRVDKYLANFTEEQTKKVADEKELLGTASDKKDKKTSAENKVAPSTLTKYAALEAAKAQKEDSQKAAAAVKKADDAQKAAKKANDDAKKALGTSSDDAKKATAHGAVAKATDDVTAAEKAKADYSGSDADVIKALDKAIDDAKVALGVAKANLTIAEAKVTTTTDDLNKANDALAKAKADNPGWDKTDTELDNAISDAENAIEDQKDAIAVAEAELAKADANKAELTDLIAKADTKNYEATVNDLKDASEAFNAAAAEVAMEALKVKLIQAEAYEILGTTPSSVDTKIAEAEAALAEAEADLAKLSVGNYDQDAVVAEKEKDLQNAETKLAIATSQLAAAQKAIDDAGIDLGLNDDEPETPAAPAEGEGESEGEGEEA